jgi:putative membrane protein
MDGSATSEAPYCGDAPVPAELLARWNFDPVLLAFLAVGVWLLARGADRRRLTALAGAAGVLVLVFVSPLCALASALFSARGLHHLLLATLAAPLLALALAPPRRPLPLGWLLGLQTAVYWAWHVPDVYAAALASTAVYWALQVALLAASAGFWQAAFDRRTPAPAAVAGLLAGMAQMGVLGALLTFAPTPLYAAHATTTTAWGLGPLADQQLAGLLMWVLSLPAYLLALLGLARRWRPGWETAA